MKLTARSIKIFLKAQGIELEECDDITIDNYAFSASECVKLRQQIEDDGSVLYNNSGHGRTAVLNPAVNAYKIHLTNMMAISQKFGLTPKDRKELLKGAETVKKSSFDLVRKSK